MVVAPETAAEALERWDQGKPVQTIDCGGMGPGYEQTIHLLVFGAVREVLDRDELLSPGWSQVATPHDWLELTSDVAEELELGATGAQVHAASELARHYVTRGWSEVVGDAAAARRIFVSKAWPRPRGSRSTELVEDLEDALSAGNFVAEHFDGTHARQIECGGCEEKLELARERVARVRGELLEGEGGG